MATPNAREQLDQVLQAPDVKSSYAAFKKLMRAKDDGLHDALVELAHASSPQRSSAAEALSKRAKKGDQRALDAVIAFAKAGRDGEVDFGIVQGAIQDIGGFKDERAFTALIELCAPDGDCRGLAVARLQDRVFRDKKARGDDRVLKAFMGLLGDNDKTTRYGAVKGLQSLKRREALQSLLPMVEDDSVDVRTGVVGALKAIGDRAALPALKARQERADEGERAFGLDAAIEKLEAGS